MTGAPQWALDKADDLCFGSTGHMRLAFAKYIAKHEQPPVGLDLERARYIAAIFAREHDAASLVAGYEAGHYDERLEMATLVAALKEGRG